MKDPDDRDQTPEQSMAPREDRGAPKEATVRRDAEGESRERRENRRWVSDRIQEMF